jgi:hypothetical protein
MSIEGTFTQASLVLVIIQVLFMSTCNVLLWRKRREYPLSYRNVCTHLTHNITAIFLTCYFFALLNYGLPDMLSVWPQYSLWTLYSGSYILDTLRLYFMFRISSERYLASSPEGEGAGNWRDLSSTHTAGEEGEPVSRFLVAILAHQRSLHSNLTYVKVLVVAVTATTLYGISANIAYIYDRNLIELWSLPLTVLIALLFVSSIVMNVILRHTRDSSGLKTEHRYICICWFVLTSFRLAYYTSLWVGVVNPIFLASRKVLFVLIFLPSYICIALLPLLKVREHRNNLALFHTAQDDGAQRTLRSVLDDKDLGDAFAQYLVGLFHPIDFQFVRATHAISCADEISFASVMQVSRKFLDPERVTAISLLSQEEWHDLALEISRRVEAWAVPGNQASQEELRHLFDPLTTALRETLERTHLPNFYCSPQYRRYYEQNKISYVVGAIAAEKRVEIEPV